MIILYYMWNRSVSMPLQILLCWKIEQTNYIECLYFNHIPPQKKSLYSFSVKMQTLISCLHLRVKRRFSNVKCLVVQWGIFSSWVMLEVYLVIPPFWFWCLCLFINFVKRCSCMLGDAFTFYVSLRGNQRKSLCIKASLQQVCRQSCCTVMIQNG